MIWKTDLKNIRNQGLLWIRMIGLLNQALLQFKFRRSIKSFKLRIRSRRHLRSLLLKSSNLTLRRMRISVNRRFWSFVRKERHKRLKLKRRKLIKSLFKEVFLKNKRKMWIDALKWIRILEWVESHSWGSKTEWIDTNKGLQCLPKDNQCLRCMVKDSLCLRCIAKDNKGLRCLPKNNLCLRCMVTWWVDQDMDKFLWCHKMARLECQCQCQCQLCLNKLRLIYDTRVPLKGLCHRSPIRTLTSKIWLVILYSILSQTLLDKIEHQKSPEWWSSYLLNRLRST